MGFLRQLKEVALSVLPIAVIAAVLGLVFGVFSGDRSIWAFLISVLLVILGLALFLLGISLGLIPVGNSIGGMAVRVRKLPVLLAIGLFLGIIITLAEPDVSVLTNQVERCNPNLNHAFLSFMIAIGVGIFVALSFLRTILQLPMKIVFAICVAVMLALGLLADEAFVSIAFDSGGATTGPMAVPFIMALGLGISSSMGKREEDGFGYTGLASVGPVLMVLLVGAFSSGSFQAVQGSETAITAMDALVGALKDVFIAFLPLSVISVVMQVTVMKMPPVKARRVYLGLAYSFIGLVIFMAAVDYSFMPVARSLGMAIQSRSNALLIAVSVLFGASVVLAEPAIYVLTEQVEEVSAGKLRKPVLLSAMCIGVSLAVALSMIRIIHGLSIWYFLIPGYGLILLALCFTPTLFAGIAFDSGGVATGPMSSTFLLPFATGAAVACGAPESASFGMIGLIAMMPVLAISVLGIIYRSAKAKEA